MTNSKSKNSKNQKNTLTKEEIQSIKARMARLKKENEEDSSSTQAILPYKTMFPDGTCHIGGQKYSQTVEFYDTNYQLATYEEKDSKFSAWCDILNYFDETIEFQNTYENQVIDKESMIQYVQIDSVDDDFNDVRKEYSDIRVNNLLGGKNGRSVKKYLTFTTEAKNIREARAKLSTVPPCNAGGRHHVDPQSDERALRQHDGNRTATLARGEFHARCSVGLQHPHGHDIRSTVDPAKRSSPASSTAMFEEWPWKQRVMYSVACRSGILRETRILYRSVTCV